MKTEQQKMLAGELYDPMDPELVAARTHARDLCQALNETQEVEQRKRRQILHELFGAGGNTVWMQPPFFCDYGSNIKLGERIFQLQLRRARRLSSADRDTSRDAALSLPVLWRQNSPVPGLVDFDTSDAQPAERPAHQSRSPLRDTSAGRERSTPSGRRIWRVLSASVVAS
jgi:maltose acetyltransferase-like protein